MQQSALNTDATITFDKVTALIGPTLSSLAPQSMFKSIRVLHQQLKRALQNLPYPPEYSSWLEETHDVARNVCITFA